MAAMISLLNCVGQSSMEIGIAQRPPATVVGTLDQDIAQMMALLSAVAGEVLLEEPYKETLGDGVWIFAADGVTPKPAFTRDDDLIAFDARLAVDGLKYRFLKAKGLEFGEEMRDFINRMNKLAGRVNGVVLDLNLDEGRIQ